VLWSYTYAEAEVERAISELGRFPTGMLAFEILSAELAAPENRSARDGRDEFISAEIPRDDQLAWPVVARAGG
jgi:hypothetical protein